MRLPLPVELNLPAAPKIRRLRGSAEKIGNGKERQLPRVSEAPPHTKFAVLPSRAVGDVRIRGPRLLLLLAIGIHASVHGICYPSQRRLAMLCGKSPSWAGKYLRQLVAAGYIRRLVPPHNRGRRMAWRIQVMWSETQPLPPKETPTERAFWAWS
ncbi:MAG: helix-turn-helix domain-containing protein [Betaproteobacteria bacterium]|nr:helix-turn-helix domain-containing protein [Betaproteobacteria bacterium]